MIYVVITKPLLYVYGPFNSREEAKLFAESAEFKAKDVGEAVVRKVEREP